MSNKKLETKTKEWMQLERKTLEQRKQADDFYELNLMKLIEEDYIRRNKNKIVETHDYYIASVGTSYEPIVLNISLFKPKKILFLYTEKSEVFLSKIVSYCKLTPEQYEKTKVSESEPLEIYRKIKWIYLEWGKPEHICMDFTGGTKAMSAAAALAGAIIDVQLVLLRN